MLPAGKVGQLIVPRPPASYRWRAVRDRLFKLFYLTAAAVATLGWIWLLAWSSMQIAA
jgi:hypothetical protein